MKSESKGIIFTLSSAVLWGIFPIIIHEKSHDFSPLFFAGIISIFTAIGSGIWMFARGKSKELIRKEAYFPLLMVSLCIILIPNILFFIGTQYTSGLNSSILMLSEIIFTLLFTPFFGEKNTIEKYIGSICVLVGGIFVLYNGKIIQLNKGDILILLSTITFPIGNFYSKKALYLVSPTVVITIRYLLGGMCLLILSLLIESHSQLNYFSVNNIIFYIVMGTILLTFCKVFFYEGMKRLDISKAISLEMTYPFFSIILLIFVFNTSIQTHQIIGIVIMVIGAFYSMKRKSETHENLKYIPKKYT